MIKMKNTKVYEIIKIYKYFLVIGLKLFAVI